MPEASAVPISALVRGESADASGPYGTRVAGRDAARVPVVFSPAGVRGVLPAGGRDGRPDRGQHRDGHAPGCADAGPGQSSPGAPVLLRARLVARPARPG